MLVVDYDEGVRKAVKAILGTCNHIVLTTGDSQSALERFEQSPYAIDLVILDAGSPPVSDTAIVVKLREIRPSVRVLMTTLDDEEEATRQFGKYGVEGFLQKPFSATELIARVMEATA